MTNVSGPIETNVVVIGAGPAGYTAAIRAGQLGLDVILVEKDAYGGTCLNYGCIPSKALLEVTTLAHNAQHAEALGIYGDLDVDVYEMNSWKDGIVDQLTTGVESLCKANGAQLLTGNATFEGKHLLRVDHPSDESTSIRFKHAVIATGSRPIEIPSFSYNEDGILDSRKALSLKSQPKSLVIIGAGYIGMELAGIFANLGTSVSMVEMQSTILPEYSDDLSLPVQDYAKERGIGFYLEHTVRGWERTDTGICVTAIPTGVSQNDSEQTKESVDITAENVLVAVGREPVSDSLNLSAAGIRINKQGFVVTDDRMRTNLDHIFAVGDIAGEPMLAHKGSMEGKTAAEVIANEPAAMDPHAIPAVVFTDPEIATAGLTETEAAERGYTPIVGTFPFRASGRALTTNRRDGFVRIVAESDSTAVIGGQIVGNEASELIAEICLAIEVGATLADIARTIHPHPTFSEAVMEAAEQALDQGIHT